MAEYKTYEEMSQKEKRDFWHRRVTSSKTVIKDSFEKEVRWYLRYFRNQFSDVLPEALLRSERVDVNIIYPIIKSMIPKLYFQDPKCFIKAQEEKIVMPVTLYNDETEEEAPAVDPVTGEPIVNEYDGPTSALILQSTINTNIRTAKLKNNVKSAIMDAELGNYGVIKTGWGLDKGVPGMDGSGYIASREDVGENCYGIRLKPWEVYPDLADFYNQEWTALGYCVHPEQLKRDKRLKNTEEIKGTAKPSESYKKAFSKLSESDMVLTEYYEIYVKPCTLYPKGAFLILSEEVKEDFLYEGDWPHESRRNPIKFLYFNQDPEGGLPIPGVRYYVNQQKMTSMVRRVQWEWGMRSIPFVGADLSGVANKTEVQKALRSGMFPKFVDTSGRRPDQVFHPVSFPSLSPDFYNLNAQIDKDVSRQAGTVGAVDPYGSSVELASVAKMTDKDEAIRNSEKSDIVKDLLSEILLQWEDLYKEYAGPENYATIDGQKFPVKWSGDMIRLKTQLEIKPFSMNYEDPTIRRRQWADILNLAISPANIQALAQQGAQMDVVKIWSRILESFDERDVEGFLISGEELPQNMVALAIQEGIDMMAGVPHQVKPTDNDPVHILIHDLFTRAGIVDMTQAHLDHEASMQSKQAMPSGGGNKEGLPVNGEAANQEQMKQPLKPSAANQKVAVAREAAGTR